VTVPDVIVVGAGVCGLACAQALSAAGLAPQVLERARGTGGRCATRRIASQPVDFGVVFLHGRAPDFLAALRAVPATILEGWPFSVDGTGRPCEPDAFAPGVCRLAYAEGVAAFPKHMGRGVEVRLGTNVVRLEPAGRSLGLALEDGARVEAEKVVLALAPEQTATLLSTVPDPSPEIRSAAALLEMTRSQPCLAVMATYPSDAARPAWQVSYPEASRVIQLVSNESSKRPAGTALALVIQAHPAWSRQHLDEPAWSEALLREAARLHGAWAARPTLVEQHRWQFARGDGTPGLSAPLWFRLPGGAHVGVAGDRFTLGVGVEAAWRSGRCLAERIVQEKRA
jgi:predicted NAD/FAD-dependent oxidoreductase